MPKPNPFLEKMEALRLKSMEIASETAEHRILEYVCLALNSPKRMKKNVFGRLRLKRLEKVLQEIDDEFGDAWYGGPEADYKQEKYDAALRRIDPTLPPFRVRYPYCHDETYNKPHKNRKR